MIYSIYYMKWKNIKTFIDGINNTEHKETGSVV